MLSADGCGYKYPGMPDFSLICVWVSFVYSCSTSNTTTITTHSITITMSAYSFDNFNTFTQVCSLTPQAPAMITYSTNVSNKKFHDLDAYQPLAEEHIDNNSNNNNNYHDEDDEDDLFQIEDVDTQDYNKRRLAGSLPSLMLDSSNVSSDEEEFEFESDFDDISSDLDISTEVVISNDWNQSSVLSPYLHPKNVSSKKSSPQLTFDSILSRNNSYSNGSTVAAVNNYNLWLSAN